MTEQKKPPSGETQGSAGQSGMGHMPRARQTPDDPDATLGEMPGEGEEVGEAGEQDAARTGRKTQQG